MKRYVKQTTNTLHYIADIRREFSNMSIPEDADCSKLGYEFLVETTVPVQEGFYAVEVAPINNVQTWELRAIDIEMLKQNYTQAIQMLMNTKAKEKGYDNIISACSYAGYDNPFRAEGETYGVWRVQCWKYAYAQLALILDGGRAMPSVEEFIAELPLLEV